MTKSSKNNIGMGSAAEKRLRQLLANILLPATRSFFKKAGLKTNDNLLSEISKGWLIGQANLTGKILELDEMTSKDLAPSDFQFCFGRFMLSSVADPQNSLKEVFERLGPSGKILLEEWGQGSLNSFPYSFAFNRFLELNKKWRNANGLQHIASWNNLLHQAGFVKISIQHVPAVFLEGRNKQVASLTFESIIDGLVKAKLADPMELHALLEELKSFEQKKHTLISLPGIYQIWASRP
ncbi:MAG: hypothetical protein AAFZ15_18485 [Bacteroidota bacterium]